MTFQQFRQLIISMSHNGDEAFKLIAAVYVLVDANQTVQFEAKKKDHNIAVSGPPF